MSNPIVLYEQLQRTNNMIAFGIAEKIKSKGISPAQFYILKHLHSGEVHIQQELADHLFVTKGNISQMVQKMEASDLIRREPSGAANRLFLTPKAEKILEQTLSIYDNYLELCFGKLNEDEQADLARVLERLEAEMEEIFWLNKMRAKNT